MATPDAISRRTMKMVMVKWVSFMVGSLFKPHGGLEGELLRETLPVVVDLLNGQWSAVTSSTDH
jgi:hypothetical protein